MMMMMMMMMMIMMMMIIVVVVVVVIIMVIYILHAYNIAKLYHGAGRPGDSSGGAPPAGAGG